MTNLSPIESEFETSEQAEAHDQWFRAKVIATTLDRKSSIPHETVMAELDLIIEQAERQQKR